MKRLLVSLIFSASALMYISSAQAAVIDLYDYAINNDGSFIEGGANYSIPTGLDGSGLGTLSYSITGAGAHSFDAFFDFEIDEALNTWTNESGSANGVLAADQSWEIDEPGYGSVPGNLGTGGTVYYGDIYSNTLNSALDNQNFYDDIDGQSLVPAVDDVSFALGWDFSLLAGETATITLKLSDVLGTSGFYLQHNDADSQANIYYWSVLEISGDKPPQVPEPASLALLGMGLVAIGAVRRRRKS